MRKEKLEKKIKHIIIFLIILLLVIMLIIGVLRLINRNKERDGIYVRPEVINPMFSDRFFKEYNGEVNKEEVLNRLTDFIYYIIDNKQEIDSLDSQKLLNQYNQNEEKFKLMGFKTKEEYLEIMSIIQNINSNELEFSYASFETNTIKKMNDKVVVKISLKFVDVDEIMLNLEIDKAYQSEDIIHISY